MPHDRVQTLYKTRPIFERVALLASALPHRIYHVESNKSHRIPGARLRAATANSWRSHHNICGHVESTE